jgi:hypothetical protein
MKDIRNTNIRFNLDNPVHQKAWGYLQTMDRNKFKSYTQVVIIALVDYFDRYYKEQDDPYFETREREERFIHQIVEEVGKQFLLAMPKYLAKPVSQTDVSLETVYEEKQEPLKNMGIDWDFIGKG